MNHAAHGRRGGSDGPGDDPGGLGVVGGNKGVQAAGVEPNDHSVDVGSRDNGVDDRVLVGLAGVADGDGLRDGSVAVQANSVSVAAEAPAKVTEPVTVCA